MDTPVYKRSLTVLGVRLSVVIEQPLEDYWVAQCVEIDVANRAGRTPHEAFKRVCDALTEETLQRQVLNTAFPLHGVQQAPRDYQTKFVHAIELPRER